MSYSCENLRASSVITMFLNRTVIKKEEKMEKKEERKPENIKKEEKDEDELKPGAANRSRVTRSGDESLWSVHEKGRGGEGSRRVAWSEGPAGSVPLLSCAACRKLLEDRASGDEMAKRGFSATSEICSFSGRDLCLLVAQ